MPTDSEAEINARHAAKMAKKKVAHDRIVASRQAEKGLTIVHTGNGKGKSSAALGMVMRAIGHGMRVGIVQFVKSDWDTGEKRLLAGFPKLVTFKSMGDGFTWDTQDRTADIAAARAGWEEVVRMIADPACAMVLADELNIVLRYDYLPLDEVLAVLAAKPADKHVIVTGRGAPQRLIDLADLVTEMTLVKHPYREQGVKAQPGIEF